MNRAEAVETAWGDRERYVRQTVRGVVELEGLSLAGDAGTVEVYAIGATDPHFRISNPPTLVPDPAGPIVGAGGRRYREDPLAALAEVVAQHGGAQDIRPRRGI